MMILWPADQVGRADRGNDASGDRLQRIGIRRASGDDGEFVAAEPRHQVVAAHNAAQTLRHVEDELVADVMAERIVDVLEVVEIDVEHRGGEPAAAHIIDRLLEALAEKYAVGQAADRIVQGQMAQLSLAGGDFLGGAPHVANAEYDEQREAGQRQHDERRDACHDRLARPVRRPGKASDNGTLGVGKAERAIGDRLGWIGGRVQVGQFEPLANLVEQAGAEIFHCDDDRRVVVALGQIGIRPDRHGRDISGLAEEVLHQDGAAARICQVLAVDQDDGVSRHCSKPPAQ